MSEWAWVLGGFLLDRELVRILALAAGLDRALAQFPEDLAEAADTVERQRSSLAPVTDPADGPWPPMRAAG